MSVGPKFQVGDLVEIISPNVWFSGDDRRDLRSLVGLVTKITDDFKHKNPRQFPVYISVSGHSMVGCYPVEIKLLHRAKFQSENEHV